jgi:hypothetical protein
MTEWAAGGGDDDEFILAATVSQGWKSIYESLHARPVSRGSEERGFV